MNYKEKIGDIVNNVDFISSYERERDIMKEIDPDYDFEETLEKIGSTIKDLDLNKIGADIFNNQINNIEIDEFQENNYLKRICDGVERIDNRVDILLEIVSDIKIGVDNQLEQGQLAQEDYNQIKSLLQLLEEKHKDESLISEYLKDMSKEALKTIFMLAFNTALKASIQ